MKKKVRKNYHDRVKKSMKTNCNAGNLIKVTDAWDVAAGRYTAGIWIGLLRS